MEPEEAAINVEASRKLATETLGKALAGAPPGLGARIVAEMTLVRRSCSFGASAHHSGREIEFDRTAGKPSVAAFCRLVSPSTAG